MTNQTSFNSVPDPNIDPLVIYVDDPVHDTVHQPCTAFNQGFEAGETSWIKVTMNPYVMDSREWYWWKMGYEEAVYRDEED